MKCNYKISGSKSTVKLCGLKAINKIKVGHDKHGKQKYRCRCAKHLKMNKTAKAKYAKAQRIIQKNNAYQDSFNYFLSQINSVTNMRVKKLIKNFCTNSPDSQIWENRLKKLIVDVLWEVDIKVYPEHEFFTSDGKVRKADLFIPKQKKIKRPILVECKSGYRGTGAQQRKPDQILQMKDGVSNGLNPEFKQAIVKTFTTDNKDSDGFIHELIYLKLIK